MCVCVYGASLVAQGCVCVCVCVFLGGSGVKSCVCVCVKYHVCVCVCVPSFPGGSGVKYPSAKAGDAALIPGLGRSLEERNGNPLQYSCLGNPMDRGAWWAAIHGVTKN